MFDVHLQYKKYKMIYVDAPTPYYQFENLSKFSDRITHFISTRNHNGSNRFTIGMNEYLDEAGVNVNREILAAQFNFKPDSYVFAEQVHGKIVEFISPEKRGLGAFNRASSLPCSDAMITHHSNICIVAQAADCVPILFYDPNKNVIASAHAGWKGTVAKIAGEVIKSYKSLYNSNPQDIIVGIGPSIGPCCYEVGHEVAEQAKESFINTDKLLIQNPKYTKPVLNLWEANISALIEQGVKPENIEVAKVCTKCNNSEFFSARAGDRGRFGGFIMLKKSDK